MPNPNATVFIVDPDSLVRTSLATLIRRAGFTPETFGSADAFLARAAPDGAGCVVLDVVLPDLTGLNRLRDIAAERKETPIIAVASRGDIPMTVGAMKAGAVEVLTKPLAPDVLLGAIEQAIARSRAIRAQDAELLELRSRYRSLSRREREVMAHVVAGHLNKRIAIALGICEITVKAHRAKAMHKMQAGSVAKLVTMAMQLELSPAPTTATLAATSLRASYDVTSLTRIGTPLRALA